MSGRQGPAALPVEPPGVLLQVLEVLVAWAAVPRQAVGARPQEARVVLGVRQAPPQGEVWQAARQREER